VSPFRASSDDAQIRRSLADATPRPYWLDDPTAPDPAAALGEDIACDLLVVGGGFSGLWTALMAKEQDPSLDVVLVEGQQIAWAATGRNGGFVSASLTHGLPNGVERFEKEMPTLVRMGDENLAGIESTLDRYSIAADWEHTGEISVATEPWQVPLLAEYADLAARYGQKTEIWDAEQVRANVASPTYLGGLVEAEGTAIVNPAKLAWGLADACRSVGVRIYERTEVTELTDEGSALVARTPYGQITASRVALATNIFPHLIKRARLYVVPVWDYVLMTEPLSPTQLSDIGWSGRQGIGDSGNQFHYYRLTADNRILWGGYDAIYNYGSGMERRHEHRPESYTKLAGHFFETFPQLEGLTFSHVWGGAIDTSTRFCAFWGQAYQGRVAYVMGYTGLGVGATRFGAQVMLDLLSGRRTERTELDFVKSKPVPFPPEPFRYAGVQLTRWSLDRADRRDGRRNLWLKSLDRLGLGFDS
jgi:glycine/D-amino acid oxidase-like deaminating enzyme